MALSENRATHFLKGFQLVHHHVPSFFENKKHASQNGHMPQFLGWSKSHCSLRPGLWGNSSPKRFSRGEVLMGKSSNYMVAFPASHFEWDGNHHDSHYECWMNNNTMFSVSELQICGCYFCTSYTVYASIVQDVGMELNPNPIIKGHQMTGYFWANYPVVIKGGKSPVVFLWKNVHFWRMLRAPNHRPNPLLEGWEKPCSRPVFLYNSQGLIGIVKWTRAGILSATLIWI